MTTHPASQHLAPLPSGSLRGRGRGERRNELRRRNGAHLPARSCGGVHRVVCIGLPACYQPRPMSIGCPRSNEGAGTSGTIDVEVLAVPWFDAKTLPCRQESVFEWCASVIDRR